MFYIKPSLVRWSSPNTIIGGINGKIRFIFLDLDVLSPLYITLTAGTIGAYEADE